MCQKGQEKVWDKGIKNRKWQVVKTLNAQLVTRNNLYHFPAPSKKQRAEGIELKTTPTLGDLYFVN